MISTPRERLAAHLQRHARTLHRIACGFGCQRDADDVVQTLYTRWWKRLSADPSWTPPETHVELFVCAKNVVMDLAAMESRQRALLEGVPRPISSGVRPDDALHACGRLEWILGRMPAHLSEVLQAALASGRRDDREVASELGISTATFTTRLFKARRAAEDLATLYDTLPSDEASLLASLRYGDRTRSEIARSLGLTLDELSDRWGAALDALQLTRGRAS